MYHQRSLTPKLHITSIILASSSSSTPRDCRTAVPQSSSARAACHRSSSSALCDGLRHSSTGVSCVSMLEQTKRWAVLCASCPHKGQRGTSAALMLCRYCCSLGHFCARSRAWVLLVALGSISVWHHHSCLPHPSLYSHLSSVSPHLRPIHTCVHSFPFVQGIHPLLSLAESS